MLIKRVVIQGFKTFATKTEFIFDPGITAVVGPNGSGKSNIVDAVRWCLGEQSFSLLRSKKTADIIFSGSDKKARLSMAQVSLTLDNSQNAIPIDFHEVEITRRAYRDGDNEYLLNGQRVRLLDITEMLAQTGLGKRTYALIGQGLIDRVLRLAPDERRSLFEEAAGITAYQMKRQTTLRRLDATEQNLVRVHDITAELSPRLGYLRRQAERALEREQIAGDLRGMLRIYYGYRWHTALAALERNTAAEADLRRAVATRQTVLRELTKQIESLRQEQTMLRARLGEQHQASSDTHRRLEGIGRELAVTQERVRQLRERSEEISRELVPLRLQQETLQSRLGEIEQSVETATGAARERQAEVEEIQKVLVERQAERTRLQNALDAARNQLTTLMREQADSQSRLTQLAERRSALGSEQENLQENCARLEKEAAALQSNLGKAEDDAQAVEADAADCRKAIEALELTAGDLRRQLAAAAEARQQADRVADRIQTRYELLRRLSQEGAGYASGVRAVLQTRRPGKNGDTADGIVGTVASILRVPPELDKAIEIALGGAFQNVVTRSWDAARRAIEQLKQSGRGRATFLPMDRLSVLPAIAAPAVSGILGNAAELVDVDDEYAAIAQQLLGRVWIAQDLQAARRALDSLRKGSRPTVVTVSGEIIRPGGAVTGGSDHTRSDDSILARERELRELPAQLEAAQSHVATTTASCARLTQQIEANQAQADILQDKLTDLSHAERNRRAQLEELRRQWDRAQQAAHWQRQRLSEAEAEVQQSISFAAQLKNTLELLSGRQQAAQSTLEATENDLAQAGATQLLQQLADLRAAAAEAQAHLRSQQTLLENMRRTLQSVIDQIGSKEERVETLAQEATSLEARIHDLGGQETALAHQLSALRAKIEPDEKVLSAREKAQLEHESQERTYQQMLRKDETAWNAAQLQLQRTEDSIEQLRSEIEQDLGLVLMEEESEDMAYQPPLPLDAFVEQLPVVEELAEGLDVEVKEMRMRLSRVSNVNPEAPREYEEAAGRHEFLLTQSRDLETAASDLRKVIRELDELMEVEFLKTFKAVAIEFEHFFKILFNGGTAKLILTEPDDITNTGIEILARPPGKRPQSLALLSGGERTLSALSLIFAILRVSPTPFCVLDEVDAALDEANVDRFRKTLEELSDGTQFIVVTHNRRTLEGANAIYGVTMGNDGVSKVISLKMEGDKIVVSDGEDSDAEIDKIEEIVQM